MSIPPARFDCNMFVKDIYEIEGYYTTKPGKGHADFIFKSFSQLYISFPRHNYLEGTT